MKESEDTSLENSANKEGVQAEVSPETFERIKQIFVERLEARFTDPDSSLELPDFVLPVPELVRQGKKVKPYPGRSIDLEAVLIMICQEHHLNPDQIDQIINKIFLKS